MTKIEKKVYKLSNIGHSDLVHGAYLDLAHMYFCVKYKGSVNNQIDMRDG